VTIVLHTNFADGRLHIWGERAQASHHAPMDADTLRSLLEARVPEVRRAQTARLVLRLPAKDDEVLPSAPLIRRAAIVDPGAPTTLREETIETLALEPADASVVLERLVDLDGDAPALAPSVRFAERVQALARHILSRQRFVPMLCHDSEGNLSAAWRPWLADEETLERVRALLASMPPAFRAVVSDTPDEPWLILEDMLWRLVDAQCRRVLIDEAMRETIATRDPADPHVAWLAGLLDAANTVRAQPRERQTLIRGVRGWIARLEDRGQDAAWHLALRLNEPLTLDDGSAELWSLSFHLQAQENEQVVVDAADLWLLSPDGATVQGLQLDNPHELLLAELARAARIYKPLEKALEQPEPVDLTLDTRQAYDFLREVRPLLVEQGITVLAPDWWQSARSRLGARLRISEPDQTGDAAIRPSQSSVGLGALVNYHWEIAVGDTTLTLKQFEQLASLKTPLVRMGGRWVEVRPEDVQNAIRFIQENPGGTMSVGDAMRLAFASDTQQTGIPVLGLDASGWVGAMLEGENAQLPIIEPPEGFRGTLRPYQIRGVSWMRFLESFSFGLCLADDMGLGKTIQLLALLQLEREESDEPVGPTLLIAPTSVLGNWSHEARRFTPALRTTIHHGVERLQGEAFEAAARESDLVITTYALAHRDQDTLQRLHWHRIVLDEAQFIKNPGARQTQAVRALSADRRVALTGTPVENRLGELWSIMDFLNPGYLGGAHQFRTRFAIPIERRKDKERMRKLRALVQPFILRRLKTDASVVSDLPEKIESREYCHLTPEQAELYENTVSRMLARVDAADGIQRRGEVLAGLIRLKQICNHPSQILRDVPDDEPPLASRSGKCVRLIEQLDEVLAEGDQALIFTQFRQMGALLQRMLAFELDREILFLHGGTPRGQRERLVERFQKGDAPVLLLSLRAGGVGLNLTAATHVFHFDRWWNPAVENQATDRAYRIGQSRTVLVHKYLVRGTLEERIDEMIEQKIELAENIIGSGENWLTELDSDDLRDLLALRQDAIGDDA